MINERQKVLLKLIVEEYIKEAKPISSKSLCEQLNCSSATIRSEMAYLEEIGLLVKTHTSSGRIPSEHGYRFYVDNIMEPEKLSEEDAFKLQTIFHNKSLMISDVLLRSMEIISEMTNYTAVVLGDKSLENKISKVEVVPLENNNLIAIVITDKGHVEHRNMFIDEVISGEEIRKTVDLINKFIIGTPLSEVSAKLEFEVKPRIGDFIKQHDAIYNAFYNVFSDLTKESMFKMAGRTNMLKQPEFSDIDKIRTIINKFDDKEMVSKIKEEENGINVYIGSENSFDENVTIIKAKYEVSGVEGTIAIIGPKRMNYKKVTTLLDFIIENIRGD